MKRFLTTCLTVLATGTMAMAQNETVIVDDNSNPEVAALRQEVQQLKLQTQNTQDEARLAKAWKRKKYMGLSYGSQTIENLDDNWKLKSDLSIGYQWDFVNIRFHSKPIADMVYISMDLGLNINFARYKGQGVSTSAGFDSEWSSDDDEFEMPDIDLEVQPFQLDAGIQIGPRVSVAPLTPLGYKWSDIKVDAWYYAIPSYTGLLYDNDVSGGFNFINTIGVGLTWKRLSIGYEYRFSKPTLKNLATIDEDLVEEGISSSGAKQKHSVCSSRFVLRLTM